LRLLEEPHDCYIFNGIPPVNLPPEARDRLIEGVSKGAGLVLIGVDDENLLKSEARISSVPHFLAASVGDAFTIQDGRGIRLPACPNIQYHLGWETEYDYWQERLGRAVLWAAGREPKISLEVNVDRGEFNRQNLPTEAITVQWEGGKEPLTIEARLRRHDGQIIDARKKNISDPDGSLRLQIPVVRADRYYVDIWAKSERGIESWDTTSFTVDADRNIKEVKLNRNWGEIGQTISGVVTLTEPLTPSPLRAMATGVSTSERLRIQLLDRRGRVLDRTYPQSDGWTPDFSRDSAEFQFPIRAWMPMLLRVEATIMANDDEVARKYDYFRITKRHRGQFNFLVWDYPRGTLAPYAEESLAQLGTTVHLSSGNPPLYLAAYDIAYVPYTTRILAPHDGNGVMQPMCWNDEPRVSDYVCGIAERHVESRQHGVFVYSLGDETVTKGSCVHPARNEVERRSGFSCLKAYQDYLKKEYGEIQALNASWNSDYESFDEVALLNPKDNDETQAFEEKKYPRWYDRQAFKSHNFVNFCERFGQAFKDIDPEARTGFEGAGRMENGDDFDLIVRTNGFWSPYPGLGDEIIRSIAKPDFPRANWMGYTKDADSLLSKYWRMITRGMTSVWWWRWDNIGRFHGLLAPNFAPFPAIRELMDDTKIVRDGLGTLLMHSEMLDDGIAILHSQPSVYANRIEPSESYGKYTDAHAAWHSAIRELGLQFRYVTDRMLRLGEFDAQKYKLLILPQSEAIGPKEAEAIKRFVQKGGTVIADIRPGLYDNHCKPQKIGPLDELFGLERIDNVEAATADGHIKGAVGDAEIALSPENIKFDPAVCLADATALGKAEDSPLLVKHKVGKGWAVLLNFSMSTFPNLGDRKTPEAAAELMKQFFALGGVQPKLALQDADGSRARNVELVRWKDRGIDIIALFRESGEGEMVTVALPEARHVYDLRNHTYLGLTKDFTAEIIPSRANLFVITPHELPPAQITIRPKNAIPGEVVRAKIEVPNAIGQHALRIRATTPEGQPADWLDQVVLTNSEGVEVEIPIALNDPKGIWTIRAVDMFTNKSVAAELNVQDET